MFDKPISAERRPLVVCALLIGYFALVVTAFFLHGCGRAKPEPSLADPSERAAAVFAEGGRRLVENHLEGGDVVSRKQDGSADKVGEGILWGGGAAGTLPCAEARIIIDGLVAQITARAGAIRRFEPLPKEYKGQELNFDGETGLIFGFANYAVRCPQDRDRVAAAWALHQQSIAAHGGELYPGTGLKMALGFGFTTAALSHLLNGGPDPGSPRQLEQAAAAWVGTVSASWQAYEVHLRDTPAACYPANLSFWHLQTAEALGYRISDAGRAEFCAATAQMGIPDIDEWCGRGGLAAWADGFVPNAWEYRFQRCAPPWEKPDGAGEITPELDLLKALRQLYTLPN